VKRVTLVCFGNKKLWDRSCVDARKDSLWSRMVRSVRAAARFSGDAVWAKKIA
jgi:hypothetical protein